jgi:hypothetical protein
MYFGINFLVLALIAARMSIITQNYNT